MDLVNQGESSGNLSIMPAKRRRGRPPKDPSLKHAEASHVFHDYGTKQNLPQTADRSVGAESMVGQTVTGVIEATFDAGYLLSVRIGDSNTNLRGMVFKPGCCVPITSENDVAPHVPMIRRKEIHFTAGNQGQSHGQKLSAQTAAVVHSKRKYTPRRTPAPVPSTGVNGNLAPVILQPANLPRGVLSSDPGDEDVHMVEPLSMLPPDQCVPAGQIFVSAQGHSNHEVAPGSEPEDCSLNEATSEEKSKPMTPADIDTPCSSRTSDSKTEDGKETAKSSPEDSVVVSKQDLGSTTPTQLLSTEPLQSAPVMKPLFSYGTGRMTELLQAVQENMKDNQVQFAEQPSFATGVEYREPTTVEFDPKNQVPHDGNP